MPLQRGEVQGHDFNRMVVDFTMPQAGWPVANMAERGRSRCLHPPSANHRVRRAIGNKAPIELVNRSAALEKS